MPRPCITLSSVARMWPCKSYFGFVWCCIGRPPPNLRSGWASATAFFISASNSCLFKPHPPHPLLGLYKTHHPPSPLAKHFLLTATRHKPLILQSSAESETTPATSSFADNNILCARTFQ